jgi:uncharacterized phage protein (TIGR01671 family)
MNDRHRFKVWDKHKGLWLDEGKVAFDNLDNFYIFDDACEDTNRKDEDGNYYWEILLLKNSDRYIKADCTGLKDKSGKLIYGGDILQINWDAESELALVMYVGAGFDFVKIGADEHVWVSWRELPAAIEIIGNIYENPELLEEVESK